MTKFSQLPEYEKELRKLSKKFPSIKKDIEDIKHIILSEPAGIGKNFTIISSTEFVKIIKARIHCESLQSRTIRLIYSYHKARVEFLYIEIYFKGQKENEDRNRINEYLKSIEV